MQRPTTLNPLRRTESQDRMVARNRRDRQPARPVPDGPMSPRAVANLGGLGVTAMDFAPASTESLPQVGGMRGSISFSDLRTPAIRRCASVPPLTVAKDLPLYPTCFPNI